VNNRRATALDVPILDNKEHVRENFGIEGQHSFVDAKKGALAREDDISVVKVNEVVRLSLPFFWGFFNMRTFRPN